MVADTQQKMTGMVEEMASSFRSAMDAGRRAQESMFKSASDTWKNPADFEQARVRGERMMEAFVPFVDRNVATFTETMDATMRAGLDVFKAAFDAASVTEPTNYYEKTRRLMDAQFEAARRNMDVIGKAGVKTLDNWSTFCSATCCDTSKPAGKNAGK